jgi:TolC family type I secretion outer membrane protein
MSVTIDQPVWRGGRTEAQTEQALNLVNAQRATLVSVEQSTFLTVTTDYMNVVEARAVLDLNINNEQVFRRQLEATQDEFRVGEVTRTDVAQSEAAYANAIAQRKSAEGSLQVARAQYAHDVGQDPGDLVAPTAAPELPTARDEATGLARDAAPTVIAAKATVAAAEADIRLIRGQLLPTLSLQGVVQRNTENEFVKDKTDSETLTAQVSMPIYEGGLIYSQSRQAQQTLAQNQHQLEDAIRLAVQNASQAWDNLQSTRATIVSYKEQVRASEIALEGVRQEQQVGERTILDVLNQEQSLFQARVNLVQSQTNEVIYEFTLDQTVGRLTAENLNLQVPYYDPNRNFQAVRDKWFGFGTAE